MVAFLTGLLLTLNQVRFPRRRVQSQRLTEHPIRMELGRTVESVVNTFQQGTLRTTPVFALSSGEFVLAMEVMKCIIKHSNPSNELAAVNSVRWQVSLDPQTGMIEVGDNGWNEILLADEHQIIGQSGAATADGAVYSGSTSKNYDFTADGNGELVISRDIFLDVQGTGNASVRAASGYLLYYPVEVNAMQLVVENVLND